MSMGNEFCSAVAGKCTNQCELLFSQMLFLQPEAVAGQPGLSVQFE